MYLTFTERPDAQDGSDRQSDKRTWGDAITVEMENAKFSVPVYHECESEQYVDFYYRDEKTGNLERFKRTQGIAFCKSLEEKRAHGAMLVLKYETLLRSGWNPFEDNRRSRNINYLEYQRKSKKETDPDHNFTYWLNLFLDNKRKLDRADKTLATYTSKFRKFESWAIKKNLNNLPYTAFTLINAQQFSDELRAGKVTGKAVKSNVTYNSYIHMMRSLWIWFEETNETIPVKNHWNKIELLPEAKKRAITFTKEQSAIVFEELLSSNEEWLWCVCMLIYKTFIRPGREMTGIKIKDIDITSFKIWINATTAKNKLTLPVPLIRPVIDFFQKKNIFSLPPEWYVFGKNGPSPEIASRDFWSKKFTRILKAYNARHNKTMFFPGQTIYIFKHTGNKEYHENGMPLKKQMELNRHQSLEETDTYITGLVSFNPDDLDQYSSK